MQFYTKCKQNQGLASFCFVHQNILFFPVAFFDISQTSFTVFFFFFSIFHRFSTIINNYFHHCLCIIYSSYNFLQLLNITKFVMEIGEIAATSQLNFLKYVSFFHNSFAISTIYLYIFKTFKNFARIYFRVPYLF